MAESEPSQPTSAPPGRGGNRNNGRNGHHANTNNHRGGARKNRTDEGSTPADFDANAPRRGGNKNSRKPKTASSFDHLIKNRFKHGNITMTGHKVDCDICCQPSDVFGIGSCNHPVCMECCIRMRVLGESKSCPQCRTTIETLSFVPAPRSWENYCIPPLKVEHKASAKYDLIFTNNYTANCYDAYMAHSCQICSKNGDVVEFPTFGALRHHTAQTHDRTYCVICVENLHILSKDRRTYTKSELERHMKGTSNEISGQKGHPTCLFCELRFFDEDFRYRHLRKDHFYCQICDTDGGSNVFYGKIGQLYAHYRKAHHPCTDSDCVAMGIVFRTDVELGIHRAEKHGGGSRNVNIDFQFSDRNLGNRIARSGMNADIVRNEPSARQERISVVYCEPPPQPTNPNLTSTIVPSAQNNSVRIVRSGYQASNQDFPTLATAPAATTNTYTMPNWRQEVQAQRVQQPTTQPLQISSGEQFPSLGNPANSRAKNKPSVWGKGAPAALFKQEAPTAPKPAAPASSSNPRRHFLPCPDIWPDGMRERVEAKMKGLPDPGSSEPVPLDPLFRVEEAKRAKRAAAKKKSKTVPIATALHQIEQQHNKELSQSSKFSALTEVEEDAGSSSNRKSPTQISCTRVQDNFVRIEAVPTLRSVAASIGKKEGEAGPDSSSTSSKNAGVAKSKQEAGAKSNNATTTAAAATATNHATTGSALFNDDTAFPSLTDIVTGLWQFGRPSTTSANSSGSGAAPSSVWSTGPPPGFS